VVVYLPGEGTGRAAPIEESLSEIIARMNEKYGANLSESDRVFFDRVFEQMAKDPIIQLEASANSVEDFGQGFEPRFLSAVVDEISNNEQAAKRALDEKELRRELIDAGRPWVHARAKVARLRVAPIGDLLGPDREDQHLEYKSTLRWDIKAETKTSIPEDAVVKTIAGFANSEHGGTLLIGVRDDGTIFGLERDYLTFSKRQERGDHDLLGQHLQNLIVSRLGHAAATLVEWEFFQIDGEDLCRVNVSPSGFPVYDTKGNQRILWWRFPTGTMGISDDREQQQIVLRRWQGSMSRRKENR
jgi:type I restriction enzyme R subunit